MTEKKEYIEREATLRNLADDLPYKGSVKRVIMQAPAADVVEVVRCKDCKHWRHETAERIERYECNIFSGAYDRGYPTNADDFCSYGERKERG